MQVKSPENLKLTDKEREVLEMLYQRGCTPGRYGMESVYMRLVKRLMIGTADKLPNGEGGVSAITALGCKALGVDPDACPSKIGEPLPYWVERAA